MQPKAYGINTHPATAPSFIPFPFVCFCPLINSLSFFPFFLLKNSFFLNRCEKYLLIILKFTIMELVGRITKDAVVSQLKDERKVVNFSIAVNDNYRPKGSNEVKKITTFVNCSYWINAGIAPYLTKGILAEVSGRISVSAYTDLNKEAKGSLNFHVNNIKIHGNVRAAAIEKEVAVQPEEPGDDLPF